MLVTDRDDLADKIRILRSHGMTTLTWDRFKGHASTYDVVALGYNYRIDEMRSAMGRIQLGKLPAGNTRRGQLVQLYRELLAELTPSIQVPFTQQRVLSSYHIMPVLLPKGMDKQAVMAAMKEQGIQTSWHYPPVHTFSIYAANWDSQTQPLPLTESIAAREITLPLYPTMAEEQVEMVVQALQTSLA